MPFPKGRVRDITGQQFGRLTAVKYIGRFKTYTLWLCRCECGATVEIPLQSLRTGGTSSCGCLRREWLMTANVRHGHNARTGRTREYYSWANMLSRCYNENHDRYSDWGGRGIRVCRRWRLSFESFLEDMGQRPKGRSLDRVNNNGDYTPRNCKWSTPSEQRRNSRSRRSKVHTKTMR